MNGYLWVVPLFILAAGVYVWWPPEDQPDRYSELGAAMIGGSVVAFAVLALEQRYAKESEKRSLQIMLGAEETLAGIDLSNRDLSGFYLPNKDFTSANFRGTNLRGANLAGTNLQHAIFNGADLRGAKLDKVSLKPGPTLKPAEDLKPGAIICDANLQNISLVGAKYDSLTRWPAGFDPSKTGAVLV